MSGLFVKTDGTGADHVVLVHGFGGSHSAWNAIVPAIAGVATCHAVDLPGHAGSIDYPGAGPTKVAVASVLEAMDERGIASFHLGGHSLGGAVATLVALAAPDRVRSLTLLAPGGFGPEINIRLLRRFAAARDAEAIRLVLEGMVGFLSPVADDMVALLADLRARPGQTELLMRFAEGLARNGRQGSIPREQLATLAMPVRLLWGLQDNVLPARQADTVPDTFAVERLAETGHMLMDEAPDKVVAALMEQIGR